MNPPLKSKINITALVTQIATIVLLMGFIPEQYTSHILIIIGLVMPTIVQYWRTYKTDKSK